MNTSSRVRRPSLPFRPDSEGTRECVDEDLGSFDRHCSDINLLLRSSSVEYAGGPGAVLSRGGSGGWRPLGGSRDDGEGALGRSCSIRAFSES